MKTNNVVPAVTGRTIKADRDVEAVIEYMERHIASTRLVGVASSVARMAELLWGKEEQELIIPLALTAPKKDRENR